MSMSEHEEKMLAFEMYKSIIEGKKQVDDGKNVDGKTAMTLLKEKYAE